MFGRFLDTFKTEKRTPMNLHEGVEKGNVKAVKMAIQVGSDVNVFKNGLTPLMLACQHGQTKIVQELLKVPGINPNLKESINGNTALIFACEYFNIDIVKVLIKFPGIDINHVNKNERTAIAQACARNSTEIVQLMLTIPNIDINTSNLLAIACNNNNLNIIKKLLTVPYIDVNNDKYYIPGRTPIYFAIRNKNNEIFDMLMNHPNIDSMKGIDAKILENTSTYIKNKLLNYLALNPSKSVKIVSELQTATNRSKLNPYMKSLRTPFGNIKKWKNMRIERYL